MKVCNTCVCLLTQRLQLWQVLEPLIPGDCQERTWMTRVHWAVRTPSASPSCSSTMFCTSKILYSECQQIKYTRKPGSGIHSWWLCVLSFLVFTEGAFVLFPCRKWTLDNGTPQFAQSFGGRVRMLNKVSRLSLLLHGEITPAVLLSLHFLSLADNGLSLLRERGWWEEKGTSGHHRTENRGKECGSANSNLFFCGLQRCDIIREAKAEDSGHIVLWGWGPICLLSTCIFSLLNPIGWHWTCPLGQQLLVGKKEEGWAGSRLGRMLAC
jgi:hypothetical protein